MSKIRRNDPCPCGSGKKYKKCHGFSQAATSNLANINSELQRLHQALISFVSNHYEKQIETRAKETYTTDVLTNADALDVYYTGLSTWMICNDHFLKNNGTIFEAFYQKNRLKMNQQAADQFRQWASEAPSVYEVISINENNLASVKEILTDQVYQIPYNDRDDYIEGSVIIGILVPFQGYHDFLNIVIKLYHHDKEKLAELLEAYTQKSGGMTKNFPAFLADTLAQGAEFVQWENTSQEKVAQLFTEKLIEKNISDQKIFDGILLWNTFCQKNHPTIKKVETYAAALEYYVQKHLFEETTVTQDQLAEEYGVSSASISANYRKLLEG